MDPENASNELTSPKDRKRRFSLLDTVILPYVPSEPYGLMASEEGVEPEVRAMALRRVRGFLGGVWKAIEENQIIVKKITGGLSNYLYMCQLPEGVLPLGSEPRHAMLRIYGEILQENIDSLVIDTVIFALLAERGFGPKLYGVFHGGRLEQYVSHSRCLRCFELRIPSVSFKIAQKMALFHSLEMPLNKEPRFIMDMTRRLLTACDPIIWPSGRDQPPAPEFKDVVDKWDLNQEWERLQEIIDKTPSEVVFCHNDVQEGNLLLMEKLTGAPRRVSSTSPEEIPEDAYDASSGTAINQNGVASAATADSPSSGYDSSLNCGSPNDSGVHVSPSVAVDLPVIQPIDFEYCAYNYRGFDFGNHFNEWCYDYHVYEYPWYKHNDLEDYPTKDQQMLFIRTYLDTRHKNLLRMRRVKTKEGTFKEEPDSDHGIVTDSFDTATAATCLYRESNVFALLSHFMWAIWSFRQATLSKITFAYTEYGILRLEHYYKHLRRIRDEGLLPADLSQPVTDSV